MMTIVLDMTMNPQDILDEAANNLELPMEDFIALCDSLRPLIDRQNETQNGAE
jgi:hypothetical protein